MEANVRAGWLVLLLGGGCGTTDGTIDDTDGTDLGDSDTEDSDVPDDTDVDSDDDTDTTVTLGQVQAQVFVGCMGGPGLRTCHGREPFMGNLDLTQGHAYDSLVGVTASIGGVRVTPGSLEDSVLWRKLTNDLADDLSEGDPMPLGEAIQWQSLPQEQLDLVRAWILGGAHE